jgi:cyclic beta-1,2-glucan synthetase
MRRCLSFKLPVIAESDPNLKMATTYHSPSDFRLIVPLPTNPNTAAPSEDAIRLESTAVEPAAYPQERRVKVDISGWKLVDRRDSRDFLEAKRKAAVTRIDAAAEALKTVTSAGAVLAGDARILSGALSDMQLALLEAKAGIQAIQKLPHVEASGEQRPVPRSFALAAIYLQSARYAFDESGFADFVAEVQKTVPLEMFEVWNLRAFLDLVTLEQISEALSSICLDEQLGADGLSGSANAGSTPFSSLVDSLQRISELNWKLFFESISETEQVLRSDPQGAYERMDFETRQAYRAIVTDFAAHSQCSEPEVARSAIALARAALEDVPRDRGAGERKTHVGYYLMDKGKAELKGLIDYRPSLGQRIQEAVLRWPDYFYLVGIEVITLGAMVLLMILSHAKTSGILAVALFLVPAVECAVATMNLLAAALFRPQRLPRLDFSKSVPPDCATVVVVPTLLSSEEQVRHAVRGLEIRFLANRDANLHFALLTDSPDSTQQFDDKDALAGLCSRLIEQLNHTYGRERKGSFSHFHRHRTYNPSEGLWMGWERKRGKLLEFNRFLLNQEDAFPVKAGSLSALANIRYVITLDLDTQLPRDAARRLVGTLAHPLNRAVIDPASNTVVEGYGILQPRVDISVRSARRSRFASLLSGDTGYDMYTRAVSDVYQDLFGAGIFTGKGIYEVRTFQQVLEHRFPNNAVLSHDLIEGEYARTGLVSDIEVVDDYPSHLSAFARRKHRWMRGDWQIIFALLPFVRDYFGQIVRNPLSHVSRWKIIDNLRRSLTDFAIFLLLLCGWFSPLPASVYWTLAALGILAFPTYFQFVFSILTAGRALFSKAFWINLCSDFVGAHTTILFRLAFLCHQSLVALDAVVRTLVRMQLTRKKLLEWETASEAEAGDVGKHPVDAYLKWTFPISVAVVVMIGIVQPSSLPIALPFLLLWGSSNLICKWLNKPQSAREADISDEDGALVRNMALRTWRFFHEFSTQEENWLIPDIVRENPPLVAHHISPTNLGLLLNSRLAAHDFGFVSLTEFIRDTERTLAAVEQMPRFRGHLYNWYATQTLKPVEPLFVSTVDNGNLLCCLWTLKQGCLDAMKQPLFRPALWQGIFDHVDLLLELLTAEKVNPEILSAARELRQQMTELAGPDQMRFDGLPALEIDAAIFLSALSKCHPSEEVMSWGRELSSRVSNLTEMVGDFSPWLQGKLAKLLPSDLSNGKVVANFTLESATITYHGIAQKLGVSAQAAGALTGPQPAAELLREALENSARICEETIRRLTALAASAQSMIDEMQFGFLYNSKKKMLSIGYDAGEGRLSKCHYDLLPSEARAAVFGAIAKNDIPQESWFELRRMYAKFEHEPVLRSWTGTAFEYLMPNLWFKMYPNTVLEHAASASMRAQQKFARKHRIPWGISECSCNEDLPDGHYRYHAFGVPGLALNHDSSPDELVVSPYSTFLGLLIDPARALKNLRRMKKLGWLSSFGFYEAADFTPSRVSKGKRHQVVFNWMAHHQGMILVAAANMLCDSAMQRRFHAEPCVAATERILQEKRPRVITIEKDADKIRGRVTVPRGQLAAALRHPEFRDLVPGLP